MTLIGHALDLRGFRTGRLRVLRRSANDRHQKAQWVCACSCGTRLVVGSTNLSRGITHSCGQHKKCPTCKRQLRGKRADAKYCGNNCRQRAYYARLRERAAP
jgi:hypothetical protein